jgi:hypothetical protein
MAWSRAGAAQLAVGGGAVKASAVCRSTASMEAVATER